MIMRVWRGRVPIDKAEAYVAYQKEVGPPGYKVIPGNRSVWMVGRQVDDQYEIAMVTLWDSWQSIEAFAGTPPDRARYYDRDFEYLVDPPERVEHFDVLAADNLPPGTD